MIIIQSGVCFLSLQFGHLALLKLSEKIHDVRTSPCDKAQRVQKRNDSSASSCHFAGIHCGAAGNKKVQKRGNNGLEEDKLAVALRKINNEPFERNK